MRVSVVIPSFNQGRFLGAAIESVVGQSYSNTEILVLDGGSTDSSIDVIRSNANHLHFWRSGPDRGQSSAVAEGFARATGDLLMWLNSDDILLPGAIKTVVEKLNIVTSRAVLVGADILCIDEVGRVIRTRSVVRDPWKYVATGRLHVNQPGSMFSRSAYEAVGGLDPSLQYVMDTDLFVRMLAAGVTFVPITRPLAAFRLHKRSKTVSLAVAGELERSNRYLSNWRLLAGKHGYFETLGARLRYRADCCLDGTYARVALDSLRWRGRHWTSVTG